MKIDILDRSFQRGLKIINRENSRLVEDDFAKFAKEHNVTEVQSHYVESVQGAEMITQSYVLYVFYEDEIEQVMNNG